MALCLLSGYGHAQTADAQTLLLRQPTLSADRLAFVYAGDLWISERDGSNPRRLTSHPADERRPHFSPDGTHIAFTADYGGNTDVYVIPAAGGEARRLTFHPRDDTATGWSADGERVAFSSPREVGNGRSGQLYEVPLSGGLPNKVMEAPFFAGVWNGAEIAYMAFGPAYNGLYGGSAGWRGYRGGTTPSIQILDPRRGRLEQVPGERVNDIEPRWDGEALYFLSDRDGAFNVYRYDRAAGQVQKLSNETTWDAVALDVHDGTIVYEAGGRLKTLPASGGADTEIVVRLPTDLPQTRPHWRDASRTIEDAHLSPTGKRALLTARGEVFSVPTEHGSTRNLTRTGNLREYTGLWSPDGEQVAYVVDDGSGQTLAVADQSGLEAPRSYTLGSHFYQLLAWGGDGSHLVYADNHLGVHVLRLDDGRTRQIATHAYRQPMDVAISPDGAWLAYTVTRPNLLNDLMLYQFVSGEQARISDGMADVSQVAFSPDGAYLYFTASTNAGPSQVGLDLSSQEQPRRQALYGVVLAADGESPLAPRTGNEGEAEAADEAGDDGDDGDDADDKALATTRVDLEAIGDRVVAFPVAARNYTDLIVEQGGDLLFVDQVQPGATDTPAGEREEAGNALMRFDFEERTASKVADGITNVTISHDGGYLLARNAAGDLLHAKVGDSIELEKLDVSGMRLRVDPRAEWAQIFGDVLRMEQEFFYADNMHGLDWAAVGDRYRPLLEHAGRREDVNELLVMMIAELGVGHNRLGGGDVHQPEREAAVGLLGADLRIDGGRYRIAKVYDGERWNPFLAAPLARPGLGIEAGTYILAIDGEELTDADNIFERLQGTVGKQTLLTVSPNRSASRARTVVVEPAADERALRLWDWVETRRRMVDEATDGRVGYVYLPNTAGAGYTFFNRMFFAQVDKRAMIVDERSNGGGQAANYITDVLSRTYLAGWMDRDGSVFNTPGGGIYGPKVMLIDQDAGSGGDFLPYAFRHEGIGKLIGKRTWGGLIGIAANPQLMDGGGLVVPFFRFFTPDGRWAIENEGVAPDIDVGLDPVAFNRGEDTQLQRAIDEVLTELESFQPVRREEAPPLPTELGR